MDSLQERLRALGWEADHAVPGLHKYGKGFAEAADALDAKDAEIARVRAETLEEAARVAESGYRAAYPGSGVKFTLGAKDVAAAIRALTKGAE